MGLRRRGDVFAPTEFHQVSSCVPANCPAHKRRSCKHSRRFFILKKPLGSCGFGLQLLEKRDTAVSQLLYLEATALQWHFPQENATLHDARKGT
jgi:hypothetical protein